MNIRKSPEKIKEEYGMIFEKRKREGTLGQQVGGDEKKEGMEIIPADPRNIGIYIGLLRDQPKDKIVPRQEKKNVFYNFFKKIFMKGE